MDDAVIKLEGVSKYYRLYGSPRDRLKEALSPFGKMYHERFYATKNIDLEVKKGEILGVVGENGCGKSTLLKLITGVLVPSEGKVTVRGKITALLELDAGLNPEYTGVQNIYFYGAIIGYSREEMEQKYDEIVEFADIGKFIYQPLKTYSSGMKSRLGFALAVSVDPDIFIVDEVLAVGDMYFRRKCYNKIHELFEKGRTVMFVSHDSQAITQFCDRAILLHEGRLINDGAPKEIVSVYEKMLFIDHDEIVTADAGKMPEDESKDTDFTDLLTVDSAQNNGASVYGIQITDINGQDVKVLDRGNIYTIEFGIKYHRPFNKVSLGVQIRNLQGLLISGANQWDYMQEFIPEVKAGDKYMMIWKFKCCLNKGEYVIAVSSESIQSNELVKFFDAMYFKVRASSRVNGGIVNMDQEIVVIGA